ncbi:hypothetical protein MCOR27_004244 [Pyricularia oryzae]|uniref:HypA protein n=2 Tax=Pyricularia TaxID=48558 RepID=A0ABQ8P136_PYRGI|nr:hypothetical protein MCOR01_000165 [Pyricularia oryzae]KAI6304749.1 hypothetical protein MCOR33_000266 [Pyricularia grisea]KAH9428126.1 hypothetical protein MCOR02_011615 [Pyricularia oryzae]KAI6263480.1 hypothetical protein MCOR19_000378 [Pyricularia oryzae]KAI6281374.1 hypothetical protein MCOR27_004244 [Pyricularia oryzae]
MISRGWLSTVKVYTRNLPKYHSTSCPSLTSHEITRRASTMATPNRIHIAPENTGLLKVSQNADAAKTVTELLQKDLEEHHVFFNKEGFHNHIVHHLLSLYGTSAGPSSLKKAWEGNTSYQRPVQPTHASATPAQLADWATAKQYLGKEQYYPDFLAFFQREIETSSVADVLNRYVFNEGDERADDMLIRLFGGFVHPLIQLMYGIEWNQPVIVAEGLAQACVHRDDLRAFMLGAEKLSREQQKQGGDDDKMGSILSLYEAIPRDEKISSAAREEDANKMRDGVLSRAGDEMAALAARVRVRPEELHERTVEMFNAAVYVAASAAVARPVKHAKFDFFLIHHVNVSPILLSINAASWIPTAAKVRLLEWKIRIDLVQYAARAVPPLSLERIAAYQPKPKDDRFNTAAAAGSSSNVGDLVSRLHDLDDDGHAIKLVRAAAICQQVSEPLEDKLGDRLPLRGKEIWNKVHHLIVDAAEGPGPRWVRTTGLESAWKDVPDAPKL